MEANFCLNRLSFGNVLFCQMFFGMHHILIFFCCRQLKKIEKKKKLKNGVFQKMFGTVCWLVETCDHMAFYPKVKESMIWSTLDSISLVV